MAKQEEYFNYRSILEPEGVDSLLSSEGQVPVTSIGGKTICLFFSANWCRPCRNFTPNLINLYSELKASGKSFEVVFISFDRDVESFLVHFQSMPWLAVPFGAGTRDRLCSRFGVERIPSLIPLASSDGRGVEIEEDAVRLVEDYGAEAYPFGTKRREELQAMDEAKRRRGKLEELLGYGGRDFVVSRDGAKVLITDLVGKTIGLYFAACWCPPCRSFTTSLAAVYDEITRAKNTNFEIIFVSTDRDEDEFISNLEKMPWLAIPYADRGGKQALSRIFDVKIIPTLLFLGPDGRALDTDGRAMIILYGAAAYPFTGRRAAELEEATRKEGEGLPRQVGDPRHEHMLKLDMAKAYVCDACRRQGRCWVFSCQRCNFDLHPSCVVGMNI